MQNSASNLATRNRYIISAQCLSVQHESKQLSVQTIFQGQSEGQPTIYPFHSHLINHACGSGIEFYAYTWQNKTQKGIFFPFGISADNEF